MFGNEKGNRTKAVPNWWTVVVFLTGAVLGPGFLWRIPDLQLQQDRQQMEQAAATEQLRNGITDKLLMLMARSRRYSIINDSLLPTDRSQLPTEIGQRLEREFDELRRETQMLQDDLYRAEENLARIEGREPREMTVLLAPTLRFE